MNRNFRGLKYFIRSQWKRRIQHDAVSTQLRREPARAKQWDPWKSPFTWTLAIIPPFTFALGTWQVYRLQWKNDLVNKADEELSKEPITLPDHVDLSELVPYRKVLLHGQWLHDKSLLLGPRKHDTFNGYHLFTPFARASPSSPEATTILVNRGFISHEVATSHQLDAQRISELAQGQPQAAVLGLLAPPFQPGIFTPNNDSAKGQWIWADIPALVEHAGGEAANVQPIVVEAIFDGSSGEASKLIAAGQPVGRYPGIFFRNQHASYAITWYSLSVGTAFLFLRLVKKKPVSSFGRKL